MDIEPIQPHIRTIIHTEQGEIEVSSVNYRLNGRVLDETCIFAPFDYSKTMGSYDNHSAAVKHALGLVSAGLYRPAMRES